jgi:hypothetical protein
LKKNCPAGRARKRNIKIFFKIEEIRQIVKRKFEYFGSKER